MESNAERPHSNGTQGEGALFGHNYGHATSEAHTYSPAAGLQQPQQQVAVLCFEDEVQPGAR